MADDFQDYVIIMKYDFLKKIPLILVVQLPGIASTIHRFRFSSREVHP